MYIIHDIELQRYRDPKTNGSGLWEILDSITVNLDQDW